MRSTAWPVAALMLAAVVSCGRSSPDSLLSEDLRKDLAAAAASGIELANGANDSQRMRFVSEIEQVKRAEPVARRRQPQPVVQNTTSDVTEEQKAPDPAPNPVVDQPTAPEPEQPIEVAEAPRVPSVAPRPAPVPVEYPAVGNETRGGGGGGAGVEGTDIGTIIGVVIRGGGVGPGHCPPRRPGRGIPRVPRFPLDGAPVLRPILHP